MCPLRGVTYHALCEEKSFTQGVLAVTWRWIESSERIRLRWFAAILLGIFAGVHALLLWLGFEFTAYPLDCFLHFLDPALLRERLLESCFYLHIQPPLFNFLLGLGLKCAPESYVSLFHAVYLVCGFLLYLGTFLLLIRLGVSRLLALGLSTLFMLSPAFLLFEHWLFYTLPSTTLLVWSAVFLADALDTGRRRSFAGLFVGVFILCGLWSLFHLLFFALVFGALLVVCVRYRKRVIGIGLIPLLLLLSLYVKNSLLFDTFGLSSVMGRNLWINAVGSMRWEDRRRLVADGTLSDLSLIARWNSLEYYPPEFLEVQGFEHVPALRQVNKSTGAHNFNHLAHIAISKQYMQDAKAGLRHQPKAFLLSMAVSWYNYFRPAANSYCSFKNAALLRGPMALYAYGFCGRLPVDLSTHSHLVRVTNSPPHVFLILGLPLLLLYAALVTYRGKAGGVALDRTQRLLLLYLCFCIGYVALVGNTFDYGETNRYRFTTDPFYLALLGLFLQRGLSAMTMRKGATTSH